MLWQLANLYEHRRHAPRDEEVASWYRGQLFFLLSERFGRPTPQRCGLSGQPLSILQPTQLKSKELEEEVTVLPDCLCVFKTKALQRCDIDPTRTKKPVPLYVWTQSLT